MKWTRYFSGDKPWPWLPYLALYFLPWYFRAPLEAEIIATAIGIPIFMALYFLSYRYTGKGRLWCGAGMSAIGFATAPVMPSSANLLIYAAAAFGMTRPRNHAIAALALQLICILIFSLLFQMPWYFWGVAGFFTFMVGGGCIMTAELVATNIAYKKSQNQVASLAAEAERERIARDLHDLLGHSLSVVAVKADLAAKLVDADTAAAHQEILEIQQISRDALNDIRQAVAGMKQMSLTAETGMARRALASADIAFDAHITANDLPENIEATLAMLMREGVTNVIRHAGANTCRIRVEKQGEMAQFTLQDDGTGIIKKEGNGLKGMRERIAQLGGQFSISSGSGTVIEASIPYPKEAVA